MLIWLLAHAHTGVQRHTHSAPVLFDVSDDAYHAYTLPAYNKSC